MSFTYKLVTSLLIGGLLVLIVNLNGSSIPSDVKNMVLGLLGSFVGRFIFRAVSALFFTLGTMSIVISILWQIHKLIRVPIPNQSIPAPNPIPNPQPNILHPVSDEDENENEIYHDLFDYEAEEIYYDLSDSEEEESEDIDVDVQSSGESRESDCVVRHQRQRMRSTISTAQEAIDEVDEIPSPAHSSNSANRKEVARSMERAEFLANFYPRITLHQFPRGIMLPCWAFDGLFLETFMRHAGIPHSLNLNCLEIHGPYIKNETNGEKAYGLEKCMQLLATEYPEQLEELCEASADKKLLKWELKLLLEHLSVCLRAWRWVVEDAEDLRRYQPGWNIICEDFDSMSKSVKKKLCRSSMGSKTREELTQEIFQHFDSLSQLHLGSQNFLLGQDPTEIDCFAFSLLAPLLWGHQSILYFRFKEIENLTNFCFRMRALYWPDWDEQVSASLTLITRDPVNHGEFFDDDYGDMQNIAYSSHNLPMIY